MEQVSAFLKQMYLTNPDFVFTVTRDFVKNCQTPILVLPDDVPPHPYKVAMEVAMLAPNTPGQPLSVEGHAGQGPARGAPHPHVPRVQPARAVAAAEHSARRRTRPAVQSAA